MASERGVGDLQTLQGEPVFDARGEKIGAIQGYDAQAESLLVTKGWFFPKDTYVPVSAIRAHDEDGVHLVLSKEELARPDAAWERDADAGLGSTDRGVSEVVGEELRIPVHREVLAVSTRVVEEGRVHLHKQVSTERESVRVPLQQERVTVERMALGGEVDPASVPDAFVERDIEIPLYGERPVVGKRVEGVEEIVVHRGVVTEHAHVSDTVRKERVVVEGAERDGIAPEARAGRSATGGPSKRRRSSKKRGSR